VILYEQDALQLISLLKLAAPVRTGNLRNNGIAGVQIIPQGYLIQIGYPETVESLPATEDYAAATELRNRTSKGWVKKTIQYWANNLKPLLETRYEGSVDYDITEE
jgi:hypothetical protein